MYLFVSLVSLAGASYLIYTMIRDEGQEAAVVTSLEPAEHDMLSPRGEAMRRLLVSAAASLRNQVRGWLGRQDSNLQPSD